MRWPPYPTLPSSVTALTLRISADFRDEEFDPSRGPLSEIAGYLQPGVDFGNWWRIAEIMRSKAGL